MHSKVDPAALLVAVLAVGINPWSQSGPWYMINTITALVVGVVVLCFTWPMRDENGELPGARTIVAQSVALGFILTVLISWPIQGIISGCWLIGECEPSDPQVTFTDSIALCVGGASIAGFFFLLRHAAGRLKPA